MPTAEITADAGMHLFLDGNGDSIWATDHAALDILGDVDLRAAVAPTLWADPDYQAVVCKWNTNQQSYLLRIDDAGNLRLSWSPDGVAHLTAISTVVVPGTNGELLLIAATLDVNNGAAGRDIKFYYRTTTRLTAHVDIDTPLSEWTQLGATVTQAGTTSIFNSNARCEIGALAHNAGQWFGGKVYAVRVRNGIEGTVVANPNFNGYIAGSYFPDPYADAAGRVWDNLGNADLLSDPTVVARVERAHGT